MASALQKRPTAAAFIIMAQYLKARPSCLKVKKALRHPDRPCGDPLTQIALGQESRGTVHEAMHAGGMRSYALRANGNTVRTYALHNTIAQCSNKGTTCNRTGMWCVANVLGEIVNDLAKHLPRLETLSNGSTNCDLQTTWATTTTTINRQPNEFWHFAQKLLQVFCMHTAMLNSVMTLHNEQMYVELGLKEP